MDHNQPSPGPPAQTSPYSVSTWHRDCKALDKTQTNSSKEDSPVTQKKIDQVLNVAGLLQPQSVFLINKTFEKIKCGTTLEIVTDKSKATYILAGLCPRKKYSIVEKKEIRGLFHYTIIKN